MYLRFVVFCLKSLIKSYVDATPKGVRFPEKMQLNAQLSNKILTAILNLIYVITYNGRKNIYVIIYFKMCPTGNIQHVE